MSARAVVEGSDTVDRPSSSNRSFGLRAGWAIAVASLAPLLRGAPIRVWGLAIAGSVAALSLGFPRALTPLRAGWSRVTTAFGALALGLAFFLVLTPVALVSRWMGRDALALRWSREAPTYWSSRAGERPPDLTKPF